MKTGKLWIFITAPMCFMFFILMSILEGRLDYGWLAASIESALAGIVIYSLEKQE